MIAIFEHRMDYVFFLYGSAFLVMGTLAAALRRDDRHALPWVWLQIFAFSHGLQEWIEMLVPALGDYAAVGWVRLGIMLISFVALFEFGHAARRIQVPAARFPSRSIYVPLAVLAAVGARAGQMGLDASIRLAVALPASWFCAVAFRRAALRKEPAAPALHLAAVLMLAYGVLAGLITDPAPFFPSSVLNSSAVMIVIGLPIQLLRAAAIGGLAWAVWQVVLATFDTAPQSNARPIPLLIRGTMISLLGIAFICWLATEEFGAFAQRSYRRELVARAGSVAAILDNQDLKAMTESSSDTSRAHRNTVRQLIRIRQANPDLRRVVLYTREDGRPILHAFSAAATTGTPPASALLVNDKLATYDARLFAVGQPYISDAMHERSGDWAYAAVPALVDAATGRVSMALGIEVSAENFEVRVALFRLAGLGLGMLLVMILLDFFSRHRRLWMSALQVAASEAKYRALSGELERRVNLRTQELDGANRALTAEIERTRAAELKFRTLTDQLPVVTYTVTLDADPPTTFISPQIERLLGYTPEEWLADPGLWRRMIDPDDRDRVTAAMKHGETTGEPFDAEYRIHARDGRMLWFRNSARYVMGPNGRPVAAHGVMFDISDRRAAAQALREASERYRLLFERSPVGVFHFDTQLRITECNERFLQIFHTDWGRLRQLDAHRLRDSSILPALSAVLDGREGYHEGLYRATTSDVQVWIALRTAPIVDARGAILGGVAIIEELTERHRLEEERLKTQKLESLGLLAGGIAHDFNNILTAILGNLSLVKMSNALREREVIEMLVEAERAALRAKDLTQQLLTFAKGGAPVKRTASVGELVREAAAFTVRGSAARLQFQLARDLWSADVDPGQIGQVVQNLVLNADQAMPEGGTLTIRADNVRLREGEVLPLPPGDYIRIGVMDTGIGIPEKHLPQIFDPYFTTKRKGTGLGLTTSFSIVRKHGGHVTVSSRVNEGTTFTFYLPAHAESSSNALTARDAEPAPTGHGRVLVMDDERAILDLVTRTLERAGYQVVTVAGGEQAVAAYKVAREEGHPFDVVILDLTVPGGLGGRETFQRLRQIDPGVRAIVSSGYSTDQVMSQFQALGFASVVPKPYTAAQLLAAICQAIAGSDEPSSEV